MLDLSNATIRKLAINPNFGCLTRNALDIMLEDFDWRDMAIVYLDIDNLKAANDRWGKEEVNRRIRESIEFRATDFSNYFSGDEIVAIVPVNDCLGLVQRVQRELNSRDMSATILILTNSRDIDSAEQTLSNLKYVGKNTIYVM